MDQRNLMIAIVASIAIIVGFQYFYELPRMERQREAPQQAQEEAARPTAGGTVRPSAPTGAGPTETTLAPGAPAGAAAPAASSREALLEGSPRVSIETGRLNGSISLKGGVIDDLMLADYHLTTDPDSPEIVLLSPAGAEGAYFAEFGWIPSDPAVAVPDATTAWRASGRTLTSDTPVTLSWDNGAGLRFTRTYEIDPDYMFRITQRIENLGEKTVTLFPYALVSRWGTPEVTGFYILHEGPIGAFEDVLKEEDYEDVKDEMTFSYDSTGGWIGITDKYWLVALIPDQGARIKGQFRYLGDDQLDKYQAEYVDQDGVTLVPGMSDEVSGLMFAGAKEVKLLDGYAETLDIVRFDRAVGFRWLYFLAKPLFYVLDFFHQYMGNFGVAILMLTVLIKLLFFPLANKSYRAMGRMKALQPKVAELREQFGDDKQRLHKEMMELYKREKANPMAGCWPMLIQIPVFFSLYEVLFVTIEMRHAPFFGWIDDLSAPDPTNVFNLFGLIPYQPPEMFLLGVWPLIMGISMFLQMKINPQPADPMQAKIMMALPFVFTFILARFPSGLVIYWAWNNTLTIAQQWVIMKRAAAAGAPGATAPRSLSGEVRKLLALLKSRRSAKEAPPPEPVAPTSKRKPKKAPEARTASTSPASQKPARAGRASKPKKKRKRG